MSEQNACGEPVPIVPPESIVFTAPEQPTQPCGVPPKKFERNEYGLIADCSVNYVYNEDGTINWRKMINPKFLVPNKQVFERANKPVPKVIDGLEDRELLILLGGIKELAQIRGYHSVNHLVTSPANDYVVSVCSITWIPNYETEGRSITFSAIGDASVFNTTTFGKNYLGPIAENRAFVRAVRNFLKINIVSQEEIPASGVSPEAETLDVSADLLATTMQVHGVSWEKVKAKLVEEKFPDAKNFNSVADIPKFKQFELVERIKKKKKPQS